MTASKRTRNPARGSFLARTAIALVTALVVTTTVEARDITLEELTVSVPDGWESRSPARGESTVRRWTSPDGRADLVVGVLPRATALSRAHAALTHHSLESRLGGDLGPDLDQFSYDEYAGRPAYRAHLEWVDERGFAYAQNVLVLSAEQTYVIAVSAPGRDADRYAESAFRSTRLPVPHERSSADHLAFLASIVVGAVLLRAGTLACGRWRPTSA